MEKAKNEGIKEVLLAVFVLICVGLIFTLWVNAFSEKDVETPYFYREVPELSESFDATETAMAEQSILAIGTATLPPTSAPATLTPQPSATYDLLLNFTPESDN
jgi:hypothetical protein